VSKIACTASDWNGPTLHAKQAREVDFRLEEEKDGMSTGKTLQTGEVRWATSVKK
jgi:hypothetical protein